MSDNDRLTCLNFPAIKKIGQSLAIHANGPSKLVPCQAWMLDACKRLNDGCSEDARFECRRPFNNPHCTKPK